MPDSKDNVPKPSSRFSMYPCQAFQLFHSAISLITSSSSPPSYLEITSYKLAGNLFPFQRFLTMLRKGGCGLQLPSHNFSPAVVHPKHLTQHLGPLVPTASLCLLLSPHRYTLSWTWTTSLQAWVGQKFLPAQNRRASGYQTSFL